MFDACPQFCTDNGAMIAYAGMVRFKAGATADLGVSVRPRWPLATYRLRKPHPVPESNFRHRPHESNTTGIHSKPVITSNTRNISPKIAPSRQ